MSPDTQVVWDSAHRPHTLLHLLQYIYVHQTFHRIPRHFPRTGCRLDHSGRHSLDEKVRPPPHVRHSQHARGRRLLCPLFERPPHPLHHPWSKSQSWLSNTRLPNLSLRSDCLRYLRSHESRCHEGLPPLYGSSRYALGRYPYYVHCPNYLQTKYLGVFMRKTIISVSLVALSSLLLAGCTKPSLTKDQTPAKTVSEAAEFAKAIESGKPTVCIMTKDQSSMEYQIKGKKMRIKTTTTTKDESGNPITTVGHMINDTTNLYIWDEKSGQGSKMTIPTEEETKKLAEDAKKLETQVPETTKLNNETDFIALKDQGYTVNCQAGSVDDSSFIPPTDIKFIDPAEMMKAIPSPDTAGNLDMSQLEELKKQFGGGE